MSATFEIHGTHLARNTALNLVGQVVPILVGVATIPYLVRGLGTDRFGVLSLAWVLLGYVSLFDLGLGRATTKFVAECLGRGELGRLPGLVWTSLGSQLLFGMVGCILVGAATPLLVDKLLKVPPVLAGETKRTFFILAAALPVVLATNGFRGVLEAGQRFDWVNYVKIPANVSVFLFPALALPFGLKLPGIVLLLVLARLGATLAYLALCLRLFPALGRRFPLEPNLLRPMLAFGGWVTVSSVIGPALTYLDRFFIGSIVSMAAVTYYTVPYEVITRAWIFPMSVVATLFPAFSSLQAGGAEERLQKLYASAIKWLLLIMGPLLLLVAVFAHGILQVWMGAEFATKSASTLQILSLGVLVNSLAFVPYTLLQGLGLPDVTAKFHLLELPIYIGLLWFLIGPMGISGAALAWTLRVSLDALLNFIAVAKLRMVPLGVLAQNRLLRSILAVSVFGALLAFTLPWVGAVLRQLLVATLMVALFAVVTWVLLLDSVEKKSLGSVADSFIASLLKTE